MKKIFAILLIGMFFSMGIANASPSSSHHGHNGHGSHSSHNNHNHSGSCSHNCSQSRVLLFEDNYDEVTSFAGCEDHSLVTYTKVLHYSDGSTNTYHIYKILGKDNGIIDDNLSYVKHNINSDGNHYFVVKGSSYNKSGYIIMDSNGDVQKTKGYSSINLLDRDTLLVKQDKKYGIIDFDENILADIKYKNLKNYDSALITQYNGYYGLIDKAGNVLLNNEYEKISKDGNIFVLKKKDKYGFADLCGKIVQEVQYDSVKRDGDYFKVKENGKFGFVDINGKSISPVNYKKVRVERNLPEIYINGKWRKVETI